MLGAALSMFAIIDMRKDVKILHVRGLVYNEIESLYPSWPRFCKSQNWREKIMNLIIVSFLYNFHAGVSFHKVFIPLH